MSKQHCLRGRVVRLEEVRKVIRKEKEPGRKNWEQGRRPKTMTSYAA